MITTLRLLLAFVELFALLCPLALICVALSTLGLAPLALLDFVLWRLDVLESLGDELDR